MSDALLLARAIIAERDAGRPFMTAAAERAIADLVAAYAIQDDLVAILSDRAQAPVAGYKIGMTSPRMQAMCGLDQPIHGRMLAKGIRASGVAVARVGRLGLECEFAVRLQRDLPGDGPLDDRAVAAAVGGICPAFELIDDRNADYRAIDARELIADNVWNRGAVLGEFVAPPADFAERRCTLFRDGEPIVSGDGREVLGHPYHALAWLARTLAAAGGGLTAGQIVLTGSLFAIVFPDRAARYRFVADGIGAVEVEVQDAGPDGANRSG